MSNQKDFGLALGGGAVLGAAHIGALRAIEEKSIRISAVSGTSIGAFVAALFAFGKGWEEIRDLAQDLHWMDISGVTLSQFGLLSNKKMGELLGKALGEVRLEDAERTLSNSPFWPRRNGRPKMRKLSSSPICRRLI